MRRKKRLPAILAALALVYPFSASPVAAVTFTAACGFEQNGNNVRSDAWTDATAQVQAIYVHSEFYRDGQWLQSPNDDEVNRSHAEAWSNWNFSLFWEHPTYRVKSWHNIKVNGVWQTQKFCDFSWQKP